MVRAYKGGVKKAAHKSTLLYWKRYLSVKESLPSRRIFEVNPLPCAPSTSAAGSEKKGTWDSRASAQDMEAMWNHPSVSKEWSKSGEKRGKVRFSLDTETRPYLSRVELKTVLCAIAEIVCMRYVNGIGQRIGLMGIDYPTAHWLYKYVWTWATRFMLWSQLRILGSHLNPCTLVQPTWPGYHNTMEG